MNSMGNGYRGFHFKLFGEYFLFDTVTYDICKIDQNMFDFLNGYNSKDPHILEVEKKMRKQNYFWGNDCYIGCTADSACAYLSLAPTYNCNLRCKYCSAKSGKIYTDYTDEISSFDQKTLFDAIDFFLHKAFEGRKSYRIDLVGGGEPLLNFDIIKQIIDFIHDFNNQNTDKSCKLWLCTNGTVFNDKILHYLSDHGASIGISIDGPKDVHDQFRTYANGNGTYDKIENSIKTIQDDLTLSARIRDIWGLSVVHSHNYDINKCLNHFKIMGINNVQFEFARLSKDNPFAIDETAMHEIVREYERLCESFLEDFQNGHISRLMMILNDNDYFGKFIRRILLKEVVVRRCWAGINKITICPNGDVFPCDYFVGNKTMLMGNIYTSSSLNYKILETQYVYEKKQCRNCPIRYLCGGDCFFNSYVIKGSISETADYFCWGYQQLAKMAIYICYILRYSYTELYDELRRLLYYKKQLSMER